MAQAILSTILRTVVTSVAVIGVTSPAADAQGFIGDFAPEQFQLLNSSPAFTGIDNSDIGIESTADGGLQPVVNGGVPLAPFNGLVDFSDSPDSLTLLGSDQSAILDEFGFTCSTAPANILFLCGPSDTTLFLTVPEASIISFDFDFTTFDPFGPAFDPFGFILGDSTLFGAPGTQIPGTELIDRNGPNIQAGSASVEVAADQIFGFQISTSDNQGGRSQVTISNFQVTLIDPVDPDPVDPDPVDPDPVDPDPVDPDPVSVPEPTSGVAIVLLAGLGLRLRKTANKDRLS